MSGLDAAWIERKQAEAEAEAGRPIAATIDDVCESCCRTMGWPMGYAP